MSLNSKPGAAVHEHVTLCQGTQNRRNATLDKVFYKHWYLTT